MNKQQLASRIWESANKMRSKIEANEYKDFILGFIFYKFLSDREEKFAREQGIGEEEVRSEFRETNATAVSLVQSNLGYFIAYDNLFSTWLAEGPAFDIGHVRDALSAFDRLVAPTHKKVFDKVFETLQTGLGKLGDTEITRTKSVKALLSLIRDIPMDGRQDYDVLGFVYEYLIHMFAANAGKKAGEFYTPHEVALFMAEVVADHLKDRANITIYDPTSGSGSLLINIGRAVARHLNDPNGIKYYAQELKEPTYNLTRMNLVMRGILPSNIVVRNGDTLERDWPIFDEADPEATYNPLFVDAVVSNPPYSQHWVPGDRGSDPRFAGFGLAPKSKADLAFLLHDLYHLRPDGIMTIVMPHGVLFRGKPGDGSEGDIRKALVEGNHVDAIVGLPPNIFFGTGIPTIVMVLRKSRDREDTLVVDASRGFVKDGKKNRLRASDVKRIVDTVVGRVETPGFSRRVSRAEIRENGYNLNIPRYVSKRELEHWDVRAVMEGGVPVRELDDLARYWDVFAGLRDSLFSVAGNYASVKPADIGEAISGAPSVRDYAASFGQALDGFGPWLRDRLVAHWRDVAVNAEEGGIAREIFRRIEALPLIDKYDAYQILDDEWKQTALDLEIVQTEGFDAVRQVDPHMVLKKSKTNDEETVEVQDGWEGRVLPFELVQRVHFPDDLRAFGEKDLEAGRIDAELASLAAEIPEEDREDLLTDEEGEEALDGKKVAAKAAEILSDVETNETEALDSYLELPAKEKKAFPALHPEVDWSAMPTAKNGTYNKGVVQKRLREIREAFDFPEDSSEALVLKAAGLFERAKALKSEARNLGKELERKTIDKIKSLTDEEAAALLEAKWVDPLVAKLSAMPDAVVAELAAKIGALAAKYATTLSDVEAKIASAEGALAGMLGQLEGPADDLAGIESWRKGLAR